MARSRDWLPASPPWPAAVAFVSAIALPFLHPAFVRLVPRAAARGADAGLPLVRGYQRPPAAGDTVLFLPAGAGD